jgi:hypothetical protein
LPSNYGKSLNVSDLGRGLFSFKFPAQIETSASREAPLVTPTQILLTFQEIDSPSFQTMATCLCVMVGNAEAERVFNMQNHIKTQLRNQPSIDRLAKLLRIKYHGNKKHFSLASCSGKIPSCQKPRNCFLLFFGCVLRLH